MPGGHFGTCILILGILCVLGVWFPAGSGGPFYFLNPCLWPDLSTGECVTVNTVALIP